MSRARVHEVTSPLSLFPFIGILLCTMGALLVILVVVSRSARASAERAVQAGQGAATKAAIGSTNKKIEEAKTYVANLNTIRGKAETRIRDEHARLSGVEDHIRRLHERIAMLQSAAGELDALEKEHYDDHKQAEREIDRLHKLIADSQKAVTDLQQAGNGPTKSYAVVPYEGPNGTFRRPIYIECVKDGLILQPEGVRISLDDLKPPVTPGNPLATVLRATRDHLVQLNPGTGKSRDTEPYALLLVRPDGFIGLYAGRRAIEAGDFDLGFELIESDWKIKYPASDAQLAGIQQQALEQARARQALLAAAAPRAYGGASPATSGQFDDDRYEGGGGGSGTAGFGGGGGGRGGGTHDYVVRNENDAGDEFGGDDGEGGGGSGEHGASGTRASSGEAGGAGAGVVASAGSGSGSKGDANSSPWNGSGSLAGGKLSAAGGGAGAPPAGGASGAGAAAGGAVAGAPYSSGTNAAPQSGSAPDKTLLPDGYEPQQQQGGTAIAGSGGPPQTGIEAMEAERRAERERVMGSEHRGKDWALKQKPPKAVPVRRTIHVAVKKDQLMISPDSGPAAAGKMIAMKGDTVESIDEFVKQVRDHIDGWGIAGNNLYWRPVVVLTVAPDAQQRASDLERLLKNSGLEIRSDETAKNMPQVGAHETR
jgi:hypothetical protein